MSARITADEYRAMERGSNKFNAKRTVVDGIRFDSKAEAHRYGVLKMMEQAGEIQGLRVHPRYVVHGEFVDSDGNEVAEICYVADFEYREPGVPGWVVEDVKGGRATITAASRLKHKLFRATHDVYRLRLVDKDGRKVK